MNEIEEIMIKRVDKYMDRLRYTIIRTVKQDLNNNLYDVIMPLIEQDFDMTEYIKDEIIKEINEMES